MQINGTDLIIVTTVSPYAQIAMMVSYMKHLWPDLVEEKVETNTSTKSSDPYKIPLESFVYRDQAIKDSWDRNGGTDENAEGMVQIIADPGFCTIVHECRLDSEEIRNNFMGNTQF